MGDVFNDDASSKCAHAGRALPSGTRAGNAGVKKDGNTAANRGLVAGLVPTAHPQTRVRHGAIEDRHQAGHRDGFPRPNVRVMRSIK